MTAAAAHFRVTAPVDVSVGELRGKEIDLTAIGSGGDCPITVPWPGAEDTLELEPGDTAEVQILDVDGRRIVVSSFEPADRDAAAESQLHQILDSIRIEPVP